MSGDLHQISAEIGGLKKSVELMTDLWTRQEETATAGRRVLHDKFEAFQLVITAQVQTLGLRLDRLADQVHLIEPSVQGFKEEKLREEGAKRLGKALIAALATAAGMIGWGAHELISWWLKH